MNILYTCKDHTDDYDFCPICQIEELRSKLAECKKDAERLDWLFSNTYTAIDIIGRHRKSEDRFVRATIDEAIEAEGRKE